MTADCTPESIAEQEENREPNMDTISMPIPTIPRTALCDATACASARTTCPAAESTFAVCFTSFAASLAAAAYLRFSFCF